MGLNTTYVETTIPAGATGLSGVIDLRPHSVSGIQMPTTWTAAAITFQGSQDGITYQNIYDNAGTEVSITVAASRYVTFIAGILDALNVLPYVKLRSGTNATPVDQTATRTLQLIVVPR